MRIEKGGFYMLVFPSTYHLGPWLFHSTLRPGRPRVSTSLPQVSDPLSPFYLFPGTWRRNIGPSLGQSASLTKAHCNPCHIPQFPRTGPEGGSSSSTTPPCRLQWLQRVSPGRSPGGRMRDLGGRLRSRSVAGRWIKICRTPGSHSLPV